MRPDDPRPTGHIIRRRPYLRPEHERARPAVQDAAANVVRNQIDTLYHETPKKPAVIEPLEQPETSVYDRTHEPPSHTSIHADQWKRYHSAWQDYYRQYYERYYLGEVYRMRQALESRIKPGSAPQQSDEAMPRADEVIYDLKSSLLGKVGESAVKVRRSRHFIPLMAAGLTMVVFLFLQYNRVLFANVEAYVSPGNIDPANIIVDPNANIPISKEPKLIIPKINVDVPVVYDTKPDNASQMKAMENGVAWFGIPGANSKPGQIGNTPIAGHSSNDLFDPGNFKFIFARLEQLGIGDTFYMNYEGVRYVYSVTKKEVVRPSDIDKLIYKTDKPVVTLITCVPVGTSRDRLLVTAEQINPSPTLAGPAPNAPAEKDGAEVIPSGSPTFLNRLFGNE
jgi:sortase A